MTRARAWRRARLLPVGLALALIPVGQSARAAGDDRDAQPPTGTAAARAAHTVTLVTGDKVTVTDLGGGKKTVSVDRPKGATGAVRTETSGDSITVVPDEARPYLAAGTLDRRLFDVSELIRQGLADERTGKDGKRAQAQAGSLPLIVTYGKKARAAAPRGAEKVRALPSVDGTAVEVGAGGTFWESVAGKSRQSGKKTEGARGASDGAFAGGVEKIWLDGRVEADMAESNAQIGSEKAWEAGLTGKGVKVAVLDTGVDGEHPDLKGRVGETKSFIAGEEVTDRNGHGSHVASTVGGSGAASDGKEKGVAPDADLAVGKVLSDGGSGSESEIIAGMEWAAKDIDAKIVSMSLGSQEGSDGTDPMSQAVNSLTEETGALFVIAAGNSGAPGTIGSPGAADSALTIGAVDSADRAADFTSKGPRLGDNALKPDLSAPGVEILAARSQYAQGSGDYVAMSGTSMATPHIAGVAALLAQANPDWTPGQLKNALMSTSKQLDASAYALGAGRVSVPDAVDAKITATGSADLGFYGWPYDGNKPVTREVTYTNSSDQDVTLDLALTGAPEGVVTLADTTLTVPAGGTAATTVTGDGTDAAVGNTSGQLTASVDGKAVAHTAFGLVKEEERYTLTVNVKDRAGKAAAAALTVQQLTEGADPFPASVGESGTLELRVKPGLYSVDTFLDVPGSKGKDSLGLGLLADPEIMMDRDREITLDARELREISVDVGKRTESRQLLMEYDRKAQGAQLGAAVQVPYTYDSIFAAPTDRPTKGSFEYRTVWRQGKALLAGTVGGKQVGELVVQSGGTMLDGKKKLSVVDAGNGSADTFAGKDAKGKAAVVTADGSVEPVKIAQNAQDAGAAALFVTDSEAGRLMAWFGTETYEDRPLHIATVNAADAAKLLAAAGGKKRLELTGTPYSPYIYDLSQGHKDKIGKNLAYRPGKKDLATLDAKFHAPKPVVGSEFRYSITDTFPIGFGFPERIAYPAERTDYVSTGPGQLWHTSTFQGAEGSLEQRTGTPDYQGGSRQELNWFKPVLHPWLGTGLGWGQERYGNTIDLNTPGWGDSGPDHTGFGDVWSDTTLGQTTKAYVDGKLLDSKTSSGLNLWDLDPAEKTYTVVTDTTRDAATWELATKGHSEWTFRSKETPSDRKTYLPVLNLGFDIDTDLAGDVRGGKKADIGIFSEYVEGVPAADTGKIGGGKLEVSYNDGKTWTPVKLKGHGKAAWEGTVTVPKDARYIALRASATDDRGGSVQQELIRAIGVK